MMDTGAEQDQGTAQTNTDAGTNDNATSGNGDTMLSGDAGKAGEAGDETTLSGDEGKQGEEGKQGDEGKEGDGDVALAKVEDLQLPEGMELNGEAATQVLELVNGLELPAEANRQEVLQSIVDAGTKMLNQALEQQVDAWQAKNTEWVESIKNDKDLGGDKYEETIGFVRKAFNEFAPDGLGNDLKDLGIGNHAGLVRFFYRVGKELSESNFAGQGPGNVDGGNGEPKDVADRVYGS